MNVATPLGDRSTPFCRRSGTTHAPRVVPAGPGGCPSVPLSATRALWQQLVIELLGDEPGAAR